MNTNQTKIQLAQAYQILAYLGLDDHTYTHLSARAPDGGSFYIYPFGLRFSEVTPEVFMQVDFAGEIIMGKEHQYNKTGYLIHGAIYQARPDIQAIFHIHTPEIVAVSACEQGLQPISQWALHFYHQINYHQYDSLVLDPNQGEQLIHDLGNKYNLLLRNHGSIHAGKTIHEAMFYTYHLQQACRTQCLALSMQQPLVIPDKSICEQAAKDLLSFEKDLGQRDWQAWVRLIAQAATKKQRETPSFEIKDETC